MAIVGDGNLCIYVLNVGQADTSVVVTPRGQIAVIDAVRPRKLLRLLHDLGLSRNGEIELLLITHPHNDHFSGANRLVREFHIKQAILAPFWNSFGIGPPTYRQLIARLQSDRINCHFLSGHSRWFPDGPLMDPAATSPGIDLDAPRFELSRLNAPVNDRRGL